MHKLGHILISAAFALMPTLSSANSNTPAIASPDSITEATATFIASNVRTGIDMVLRNVADMGLSVDSAQVVALVAEKIAQPYSEAAHRASAATLTQTAARLSEEREREFLSAASARPGAQTFESGVVLEILQEGAGPNPVASDTVVFHYVGRLPGGNVFDETTGGEPLSTKADNLVSGMTEGLSHMKVGGRYRLTIPSRHAYGSRGAGDVIPPNTPIEFTVELLQISSRQELSE